MNILGYTNKFSLVSEEEVEVKVSCSNIKTYKANLVKIIQGDINEKGPGYTENKVNINDLINRYKKEQAKEKTETIIFVSLALCLIVVSGIIVSL